MNMGLVSTWGIPCGIAEHAAYLVEAVEAADPTLQHTIVSDLHPDAVLQRPAGTFDLLVLNYHAALHSQWTPAHIHAAHAKGLPVLVVYHDSGTPNTDQCKGMVAAADCAVVHEPFEDLEGHVHYLRQGVPDWEVPIALGGRRPVVGTVGFDFGWKNYDLLCEASALAGWGCLIIAPDATEAREAHWREINPHLRVLRDFIPRRDVTSVLAGCDATAFLYSCQNGGTSAAIRQGIAARKPVLALRDCRQFCDLWGTDAIHWITNGSPAGVARALAVTPIQRVDAGIVAVAERDSWANAGRRYAQLYHQTVSR
mgnify:CR=1 FL=1